MAWTRGPNSLARSSGLTTDPPIRCWLRHRLQIQMYARFGSRPTRSLHRFSALATLSTL
jgi:hypothetical protein